MHLIVLIFHIQIVGHSLGGGTAALLTYILREQKEFSSSTCVMFGPGMSDQCDAYIFFLLLPTMINVHTWPFSHFVVSYLLIIFIDVRVMWTSKLKMTLKVSGFVPIASSFNQLGYRWKWKFQDYTLEKPENFLKLSWFIF